MITLTLIYSFALKGWQWLRKNLWVFGFGLLLFIILYSLFCGGRDTKPEINIVSPQKEVNAIQRERDETISNSFNAIDSQRERDDKKIEETQTKPRKRGNVNARELEEMLK